eukprot:IDg11869t1
MKVTILSALLAVALISVATGTTPASSEITTAEKAILEPEINNVADATIDTAVRYGNKHYGGGYHHYGK